MRNSKNRLPLFAGAVTYVIGLQFCYCRIISPTYGYEGYVSQSPPLCIQVLFYLMCLIPVVWMPLSVARPSQAVYWCLYLMVYIPSCVIPFYSLPNNTMENLFFLDTVLLVSFSLLGAMQNIPRVVLKRISLPSDVFWLVVISLSLCFCIVIFYVYGIPTSVESLQNVYLVRSHYSQLAGENGIVGYVVNWLGNVLNPILITYGLLRRRIIVLLIGVMGQIAIYAVTGFKSVLFSGLMLIGLLFALKFQGKYFGLRMIWGFVAIVTLGAMSGLLFHLTFFSFLLVGRPIVTPGLLTGFYYDFFSSHPKALLGHSIFRYITSYPYNVTPPHLIGSVYFHNVAVDANGNIWCDAFANFGYTGIVVFTLMLGVLLWLFDAIAQDGDYRAGVLIMGVPAFTLANAGLLTSLLTHGIGLALILYYFRPKSWTGFKHQELTGGRGVFDNISMTNHGANRSKSHSVYGGFL